MAALCALGWRAHWSCYTMTSTTIPHSRAHILPPQPIQEPNLFITLFFPAHDFCVGPCQSQVFEYDLETAGCPHTICIVGNDANKNCLRTFTSPCPISRNKTPSKSIESCASIVVFTQYCWGLRLKPIIWTIVICAEQCKSQSSGSHSTGCGGYSELHFWTSSRTSVGGVCVMEARYGPRRMLKDGALRSA